MKQVVSKWVLKASLMTLVLVASVAGAPAFGQTGQGMRLNVPFAFSFAAKLLPAGTYTFIVAGSRVTVASTTSGPTSQSVISEINGPSELFRDGSLVFDKSESGLILSEVWIPGVGGQLLHGVPKGHARTVLSAPDLNENRTYSGKAAFNLTCAKCHGGDGKGNKEADKFFDIAIPKLTSDEVQKKTDEELRTQISKGNGKMPPVEVDESGFRHRLPPNDVDAVIAYVRTLNK
jgi:mono/diheme cytochrome c family protein